jgi:thiamine pyrophosphokinase
LGYAYNSNPYRSITDKDGSFHMISGGIGIRTDHFFTDFAYVYRLYNEKSVLYNDPNVSVTDTKIFNQYILLTFGVKI